MLQFNTPIPLSLYIHFPWCVKKCPYCDFNSHTLKTDLPEEAYVDVLLLNLEQQLPLIWGRRISTLFMGGGTPSLFSATALNRLLEGIRARCLLLPDAEITLEANPGTVEQARFKAYRDIGINRISLGIQSFQKEKLARLGRIHNDIDAKRAVDAVREAGFNNFNIDLMFGLPEQSIEDGLYDLKEALSFSPSHFSWYELTIEPNTAFWQNPPELPKEEGIIALHHAGQDLLNAAGFSQYEVSAYSQNRPCRHNLNYWKFGDYLAIGAGSHGKITNVAEGSISRFHHFRHPKQYMDISQGFVQETQILPVSSLPFEFMLNALRLKEGYCRSLFQERTGLPTQSIHQPLEEGLKKGWLFLTDEKIGTTKLGFQFLNEVVALFL